MPETDILTDVVDEVKKEMAPPPAPVASRGSVKKTSAVLFPDEKIAIVPEIKGEEKKEEKIPDEKKPAEPKKEEEEPELTEAQKKSFLKKFGIDYTSDDDIKNKLKPATPEPTEEQLKKAAAARELKLLNFYVANGGTVEDFNSLGQIAKADPKEFSASQVIAELKIAGFTKEQAEAIVKERYYQIELDTIEQDILNETDVEFEARKKDLQKKIDYGAKKLATHSLYKQNQAASVLKSLADAVEAEELREKAEVTNAANVDAHLKALPREKTFELGKVSDQQILPVVHKVSEDSIKQVAELLKDPAKRNNFFYNPDNTLNLTNLTDVLLSHFEMKRTIKAALLEGQSRQVAAFEKVFPGRSPYEIGIGGSLAKNNSKGVVTSSGKPQRVMSTSPNF